MKGVHNKDNPHIAQLHVALEAIDTSKKLLAEKKLVSQAEFDRELEEWNLLLKKRSKSE